MHSALNASAAAQTDKRVVEGLVQTERWVVDEEKPW